MSKDAMDRISPMTLAAARIDARRIAQEAMAELPNGISYLGSVNYEKDLPEDAYVGDEYTVRYEGESGTERNGWKYLWDGESWVKTGQTLDLGLYIDAEGYICQRAGN